MKILFIALAEAIRFAIFGYRVVDFKPGTHAVTPECVDFLSQHFQGIFTVSETPLDEVLPRVTRCERDRLLEPEEIEYLYGDSRFSHPVLEAAPESIPEPPAELTPEPSATNEPEVQTELETLALLHSAAENLDLTDAPAAELTPEPPAPSELTLEPAAAAEQPPEPPAATAPEKTNKNKRG